MPGDLLRTLNAAIDSSEVYTGYKKARIEELRLLTPGFAYGKRFLPSY